METFGTVVAGALRLDQQLEFPDQSRVRVAVEPLEGYRSRFRAGLDSWKALCKERPVHAGGKRFSREELHERR